MTDPLSELRARIALKRRNRAKEGPEVPQEPYPRETCPLCGLEYPKLPFDGHCKDCDDKIVEKRQREYIHSKAKSATDVKLKPVKVEEWQDRY